MVTRDGAEDAHLGVPYPRALCYLYKLTVTSSCSLAFIVDDFPRLPILSKLIPGRLYHEVDKSLGKRIRQLSSNTSYQKLHFGGRRRCGKGVKRLRAILDAPRRNASCEVDRFEVAQGMDPTCTQNPWAITAVLLCTAVQPLFLFFRVHT